MHRELAAVGGRIDAVFYCPHSADDNCDCRKPKTGMIKEIAKRFSVELDQVFAVGDALRDIQAFANSGCKTILVRTGKGEETLSNGNLPGKITVCADLSEAVQHIISADN